MRGIDPTPVRPWIESLKKAYEAQDGVFNPALDPAQMSVAALSIAI